MAQLSRWEVGQEVEVQSLGGGEATGVYHGRMVYIWGVFSVAQSGLF